MNDLINAIKAVLEPVVKHGMPIYDFDVDKVTADIAQAVLSAEPPRCPHIVSSGSTQWCDLAARGPEQTIVDPDMPAQQLRMHLGEMTAQEMRTARAAIRWANSARGQATGEGLRETEEALKALVQDLEERAKWSDDCKVVVCGNGVYHRAKAAIEAFNRQPSAKPGMDSLGKQVRYTDGTYSREIGD